ncbi:MAG TPA: porin [Solimonas sp.]
MKKSTLAAALIASSAALPAYALEADASLYGDFRLSLGYFDSEVVGDDTDIDNNNSHGGLRVLVREGALAAFVQYERLLDNDDGSSDGEYTRQFFGGVVTPYGTVGYGRQATAYKLAGQKLDPFYNTSVAGISGALGSINGASYGQSALSNDSVGSGFINNQIAYVSPRWYGVVLNAAVFVDDGAGDGEEHDYALGAEYGLEGLTLGVQALGIKSGSGTGSVANFSNIGLTGPASELNAVRYYGAYATEQWGVGVSYEALDLKAGLADRGYGFVSGWYGITDRLRVAAAYGNTEDTPFAGDGYTLGASYTVLKNLTTYLAARRVERDDNVALPGHTTAVALGVSYTFDLDLIQ